MILINKFFIFSVIFYFSLLNNQIVANNILENKSVARKKRKEKIKKIVNIIKKQISIDSNSKFLFKNSRKKFFDDEFDWVPNNYSKKYIQNINMVHIRSNSFLHGLEIKIIEDIFFTESKKKVLYYYKDINSTEKYKKYTSFLELIKNSIIKYLDNYLFIRYKANQYCHCDIKNIDIRKSVYYLPKNDCNQKKESIIIYLVEKKFERIENGFKEKHNFKLLISKSGEIVNLNWKILGERIEKPKKKK